MAHQAPTRKAPVETTTGGMDEEILDEVGAQELNCTANVKKMRGKYLHHRWGMYTDKGTDKDRDIHRPTHTTKQSETWTAIKRNTKADIETDRLELEKTKLKRTKKKFPMRNVTKALFNESL